MTTYEGSNWRNEAGEPYMTAAALNFEAALDEQSAYERQFDYDYNDYDDYEPEADAPHSCTDNTSSPDGETWYCDQCEQALTGTPEDGFEGTLDAYPVVGGDYEGMEDQWLDGYMEDRMSGMYEG